MISQATQAHLAGCVFETPGLINDMVGDWRWLIGDGLLKIVNNLTAIKLLKKCAYLVFTFNLFHFQIQ